MPSQALALGLSERGQGGVLGGIKVLLTLVQPQPMLSVQEEDEGGCAPCGPALLHPAVLLGTGQGEAAISPHPALCSLLSHPLGVFRNLLSEIFSLSCPGSINAFTLIIPNSFLFLLSPQSLAFLPGHCSGFSWHHSWIHPSLPNPLSVLLFSPHLSYFFCPLQPPLLQSHVLTLQFLSSPLYPTQAPYQIPSPLASAVRSSSVSLGPPVSPLPALPTRL